MGYSSAKTLCLKPVIQGIPKAAQLKTKDLLKLYSGKHGDPFSILGLQFYTEEGEKVISVVIRVWLQTTSDVYIRIVDLPPIQMIHCADYLYMRCFKFVPFEHCDIEIFNKIIRRTKLKYEYIYSLVDRAITLNDTYSFPCVSSTKNLRLFHSGSFWDVDNFMGSHKCTFEGVRGVRFTVWAPNAQAVSVVGTWNNWDPIIHPMRHRLDYGVWEIFIPHIDAGETYKYSIYTKNNARLLKIDPYAQEFEVPPKTASVVSKYDDTYRSDPFVWSDDLWLKQRASSASNVLKQPISIYEMHLSSWIRGDNNRILNYREIAPRLINHMKNMNFTHVEFLPPTQHPFDGSWGYQVSGYYAVDSKLGSPDDFKFLVNELHRNNYGVYIDFVLAHFIKDDWCLPNFDGEPCYEYTDIREGEHKVWGTKIFNFGRNEVRSFLLGAAYHWIRRYHVDGLRIDAVSAMIYRDHGKNPGEWLPNKYGGNENLEAISMLKELNWVVHKEFPGVIMMAEDSSSWEGVTSKDGLGFDLKWDLGWMNDMLSYLCTPPDIRSSKHSKLTFRGMYMHKEHWILPLSHDEVVSGKGSLLDKCGFANTPFHERIEVLKTLFGFQIGMFGRPLIFMGAEYAQGKEWNYKQSLDWHESKEPLRNGVLQWLKDLLYIYRTIPAFYGSEIASNSMIWVDCDNYKYNLIAWVRKSELLITALLFVCNFSNINYDKYPIGVPYTCDWKLLLNSNSIEYGGDGFGGNLDLVYTSTAHGRFGWPACLTVDIPHNSCIILQTHETQ